MIGCSPCQYWSIIQTNKKKSQKSKDLLKEFHRFVRYFNPGFVVVENVPGLERNATESGLKTFMEDLDSMGYVVEYGVYNLNEYGVPQTRKRFSLIASRVCKNKISPIKSGEKKVVKDFLGELNGFVKVEAGHKDESDFQHSVAGLSNENLIALKKHLKTVEMPQKNENFLKGQVSRIAIVV
ncbi:DNA cytosine methyltransferase [Campylobacter sp. CCUG 57310]|uniref:DNA cytosine methyltransferase n=1 Tax=Campylobacter sp. CCUG 57310 TaxID=2517362 RepID=UPI0015653653|nr:DNA cytosine methyltransferase [Campylobacter sp. CCUG 57310]